MKGADGLVVTQYTPDRAKTLPGAIVVSKRISSSAASGDRAGNVATPQTSPVDQMRDIATPPRQGNDAANPSKVNISSTNECLTIPDVEAGYSVGV